MKTRAVVAAEEKQRTKDRCETPFGSLMTGIAVMVAVVVVIVVEYVFVAFGCMQQMRKEKYRVWRVPILHNLMA